MAIGEPDVPSKFQEKPVVDFTEEVDDLHGAAVEHLSSPKADEKDPAADFSKPIHDAPAAVVHPTAADDAVVLEEVIADEDIVLEEDELDYLKWWELKTEKLPGVVISGGERLKQVRRRIMNLNRAEKNMLIEAANNPPAAREEALVKKTFSDKTSNFRPQLAGESDMLYQIRYNINRWTKDLQQRERSYKRCLTTQNDDNLNHLAMKLIEVLRYQIDEPQIEEKRLAGGAVVLVEVANEAVVLEEEVSYFSGESAEKGEGVPVPSDDWKKNDAVQSENEDEKGCNQKKSY